MTGLPPYRAARIFGATWARGTEPPAAMLIRTKLRDWTVRSGDGWLLAADMAGHVADAQGVLVATTASKLFNRRESRLQDTAELAAALRGDIETLPRSLGAPFRLLWADPDRAEIHAATDALGLSHLFWARYETVAVCASTPQLLAELVGARPSRQGVAAFALLGTFPFAQTPYEDVHRLLAGHTAVLKGADIALRDRGGASDPPVSLREAFVDAVAAMDRAAPDAALELSGGLDCRLILAALPKPGRRGRTAMTLYENDPRSPDVLLARRIAAGEAMLHREVEVPLDRLPDEALPALLEHVIAGYGGMANPIDMVPLALTSSHEGTAQFGGQNGEIIRGFYYPMQPLSRPATRDLVARLVDWRIISNDRASPALFRSGEGVDALAEARDGLIEMLTFPGISWGQALDRIYLGYRMQSWAGAAVSSRFVGRTVLWPFFDETFLAAALNLDASRKRDSRVAHELLVELDPQLAAIPLDSGLVPAIMAGGGVRARGAQLLRTGKKAARKIGQRIAPRSARVLGSGLLVDHWHRCGAYRQLDLNALASFGLFDDAALEAVGSGRMKPDRATLGFLLLCETWARPSR